MGNVEISLWQMLEKLNGMIDGDKLEALKVSSCVFECECMWICVDHSMSGNMSPHVEQI